MADTDQKPDALVHIPHRTPALLARLSDRTLAAITRQILDKSQPEPLDVLPLAIGVEIDDQVAVRLIERGAALPVSASWVLSTSRDSQQEIAVRVVQGEVGQPDLHQTFATLVVSGLPPAPRGMPVSMSIDIDKNGIVSFTARSSTNISMDIKVTNATMLSQAEIERLVRKSEAL
jgi:molecular chaperone DnaK